MPAAVPGSPPATASWPALGTTVALVVGDGRALRAARAVIADQLAEIDLACSRFRADSELSFVNARAGRRVVVSPVLAAAVQVALRAAVLTDGDVDPTLGSDLELCGYDRDFALLHDRPGRASPAPVVTARRRPGWQRVQLDSRSGSLLVPSGVTLDLGATAKAWAADRCALAAHAATASAVLVSLGGDVATAGPAPSGGWRIHVTEDHRDALHAPGQTVTIRGGGLATSSTTVRRWRRRGVAMHHILDPRTGLPVNGTWRTATVAAADCVDANTASTAALVRGDGALAFLTETGLPARLVDRDGAVVIVGDWPAA